MLLDTIDPPPLTIRPVGPDYLRGNQIQPGDPWFGLISINRERVSGTPCFYGTRVPVVSLFHCFAAGETIDEFLYDFEGVTREQALGVLDLAARGLLAGLEASREHPVRP